MASEWQGGSNFILIKRGSSTSRHGGTHDGASLKRLNLTKRGRFNPNPTPSGHPNCMIHAQAKRDKAGYDFSHRPVKVYRSHLI